MLPEEIQTIEEKEPNISKECYNIYSTTNKTLKEIATLKNIKYYTLRYYSKKYKYRKRMEYYNITKPSKPRSNTNKKNTPKKKAVKNTETKKKKQAKYNVYTYEHTTKIILALTDKELKTLKTQSKKDNFLNLEDYLITTLKYFYEYIEANQLLGYPERCNHIDKNEDNIIYHELINPKLLTCKNSIQDTKQTVLEDYI